MTTHRIGYAWWAFQYLFELFTIDPKAEKSGLLTLTWTRVKHNESWQTGDRVLLDERFKDQKFGERPDARRLFLEVVECINPHTPTGVGFDQPKEGWEGAHIRVTFRQLPPEDLKPIATITGFVVEPCEIDGESAIRVQGHRTDHAAAAGHVTPGTWSAPFHDPSQVMGRRVVCEVYDEGGRLYTVGFGAQPKIELGEDGELRAQAS